MKRDLVGRQGIIVGVSSERSLGFACAQRLASAGAHVIATYRPSAAARSAVTDKLQQLEGVEALPLDVDDALALEQFFGDLRTRWDRLDFIVHTVMHVPPPILRQPLTALDHAAFNAVLSTGVYSLIALCRQAQDLLVASGSARIVTMTSESSHLATPSYHIAGICKAALEAAMRYLAFELGAHGMTCNAVSAAAISTDGADATVGADAIRQTSAYLAKRSMTKRPVEAADVADAVAWLTSAEARNFTAQVLTVDGGFTRSYF